MNGFEIMVDGVAQPGEFSTEQEANQAAMTLRHVDPARAVGVRAKQEQPRFEVEIDGKVLAEDFASDDEASAYAANQRRSDTQKIVVRPRGAAPARSPAPSSAPAVTVPGPSVAAVKGASSAPPAGDGSGVVVTATDTGASRAAKK